MLKKLKFLLEIPKRINAIINNKTLIEDMRDIENENEFREIYKKSKLYTMTSPERMYAMYKATEYISKNNISGDIVECGTWRGGSMMIGALKLLKEQDVKRKLFLYDTYEGMEYPTDKDVSFSGGTAKNKWKYFENKGEKWCYASLEEVKKNILSTGYPESQTVFVKGKVQDTIPIQNPTSISILRLDTDWYESTYHELVYLYPLLSKGGVLIIDDYGHWKGSQKAVDKYFQDNNIHLLLNRIDYTGRIGIKI